MTTAERSPCPACAEPIVPDARLCPHCRMPVLFRVLLEAPVTDGRARYRMARALAALAGKHPIGEIQARLGAAGAALASDLTRAVFADPHGGHRRRRSGCRRGRDAPTR